MISQIGAPSGSMDRLTYWRSNRRPAPFPRLTSADSLPTASRTKQRPGAKEECGSRRAARPPDIDNQKHYPRENANAHATQHDAGLHRGRSAAERQSRRRQSGAAGNAGEFRHPRGRLRLSHPYPPRPRQIPVLLRPRLYARTGFTGGNDRAAQGAEDGARGDRDALDLRHRQFGHAVRHGGAGRPRAGLP